MVSHRDRRVRVSLMFGTDMDRFDYVVVGAGSAGCVLAARLSEDPQNRVLLLEAGAADGPDNMAVPPAWPTLIGSEADWGYATVPQPAAGGIARRYPRGKVLGGSSSINAMAFIRGHRTNYDAWAAAGATGWGYEDLLPFFKRTETTDGRDPAYRGTDGPMRVAPARTANPLSYAYLEATVGAGYHHSDDLNGSDQEGICWWDLTIVDGTRQSAADGYLRPVLDRPNLTLLTNALAHRLIVANGRCAGVEYAVDSEVRQVYPQRETILSAGSIGSAQLLLLSGIGPAEHLRAVGVDTVADLPGVGANLHDHPHAGVIYTPARPVPPGQNNHSDLVAAVRTTPDLAAPDIQLLFVDVPYHPPHMAGPASGYTIPFTTLHPHSRGSVRLASADPATAPLIDPNFLGDDRDLAAMLTALDMAREIGSSPALDQWRDEEALPGPDVHDENELRDYLRRDTDPYYHPVGTCRIGTDPAAVVDPQLRVHGIDGLRVADASVMPSIPGANPNATVLAIAERAATLIGQ
ncbi:MAG: glucose-methanol-choline oxidoreductase [Dactylosporangium sp.]|jgi:choline dehydrogenase|nr:glucose-methanol-choline oxidoreductase [Dactylosporangium sp.]